MKILIMGGSGTISTAVTARLALTSQADVFVVNRGNKNAEIDTACEREAVLLNLSVKKPVYIQADCKDEARMNAVVADLLKKDERFDAVIDFIAFTEEDAARDKRGVFGENKAIHFYKLGFGLLQTAERLPYNGKHAARKSFLAVFTRQNRLRKPAHGRFPQRGLSRYDYPSEPYLLRTFRSAGPARKRRQLASRAPHARR